MSNIISKHLQRVLSILFTCLIIFAGFSTPPSLAQETSEQDIYDLILEVRHNKKTLSTAMIGLEKNGKYYIPLQDLSRIIKFNAEIDLTAGTADGFFLSEDNNYKLDIPNATYSVKDKSYPLKKEDAFIIKQRFDIGDIYVTTDVINKVWPLNLSLNNLLQVVDINTNKTLPYELASKRLQNRNRRLNKASNQKDEDQLPRIVNEYKLFSKPALDLSATTVFSDQNNGLEQSLNIAGRNDLLKAQANYNFGFSKRPDDEIRFDNSRFLLERKSYDKGDLPLNLQLLQAGDIRPRLSRLIDGSLRGRGLLFSTSPQKQQTDFDQITVEGFAEANWEVELYRNNELVSFQTVDSQGEYRFENVSLDYNNTVIKTILYGPEGQIRESEKTYNISSAMLSPGKTVFEGSVLDFNRDLIATNNRPRNSPSGLAQRYHVKHGLNSNISVFGSFTQTPTINKSRHYATLGANLSLLGMSSQVEVYKDLSGGEAIDIRSSSNIAGINISSRTAFFRDFESPEAEFGDGARKSRKEFSASKPIKTLFGNLGLRFRLDHERFEASPEKIEMELTQTYSKKKLRITHNNTTNLVNRKHQTSEGRLNTTYRINPNWQLRSQFNYDIFPDLRHNNILGELRYTDGEKFTAALTSQRDLLNQNTRIGSQIAYDFDKFRSGLNVDWNRDTGWRAFLRTSMSVAPYDENGNYIYSSQNLSSKTALNGQAFLDNNNNGLFDEGDIPIKDATVNIGRRGSSGSNNKGYASYIGSTKDQYENISLNSDSLETPFMLSKNIGHNAVLRPGTVTNLQFPVVKTGLIEGTISTDTGPLAGVKVQLINNKRQLVDTTTTAFDGYYTFEYLEPATYMVRIDPSHKKIRMPPVMASITKDDLFKYDVNFKIATKTVKETNNEDCLKALKTADAGGITQYCYAYITARSDQSKNHISVNDVRVGQHKNFTRVVLDISEPLNFQVVTAKDNKEVSILLPFTSWKTTPHWKNDDVKIIKSYSVEDLSIGGSRLIIKPKNKLYITRTEKLKPDGGYGYRVYFDIQKTK